MLFVGKLEDGTIYAKVGTNGNCGGVGTIVVKIEPNRSAEISFSEQDFECEHLDGFGYRVAGAQVSDSIKQDIFAGARESFLENRKSTGGIDFELISVSANISDFIGKKFRTAGFEAVRFWFDESNS